MHHYIRLALIRGRDAPVILGRFFLIYIIFQNKNINNQYSLKYNINQKQCNEKRRIGYGKINVQILFTKAR